MTCMSQACKNSSYSDTLQVYSMVFTRGLYYKVKLNIPICLGMLRINQTACVVSMETPACCILYSYT